MATTSTSVTMTVKKRSCSVTTSSAGHPQAHSATGTTETVYHQQRNQLPGGGNVAGERGESSSGSEDSASANMEPMSRQIKSRQSARRSKSERLTGAKPRVKRRERDLPPLSLTRTTSGSNMSDAAVVNLTPEMSPSLLRRATVRGTASKAGGKRDSPQAMRMREGSNHRRAGSVRLYGSTATPLCGSGPLRRSTFLDVPDDVDCDADDDSYRIRSFDTTRKGVVNRGDSFRRRRSRSNSLAPQLQQHDGGDAAGISLRNGNCSTESGLGTSSSSASACAAAAAIAATAALTASASVPSPASSADARDGPYRDDGDQPGNVRSYKSAMIGAHGVGKSALVGQFMTSECINAYYDRVRNDDGESTESVFVMLNGEESELVFSFFTNLKVGSVGSFLRWQFTHFQLELVLLVFRWK